MKASFIVIYVIAALAMGQDSTSASLAPSPTESVECAPHGDHWHCEGPRETLTESAEGVEETGDHDGDDDGHDDEAGTGSLASSPTGSVGCELHGDHWDCDGPAETATESTESAETGADAAEEAEETGPAAVDAGVTALPDAGLLIAGLVAGLVAA